MDRRQDVGLGRGPLARVGPGAVGERLHLSPDGGRRDARRLGRRGTAPPGARHWLVGERRRAGVDVRPAPRRALPRRHQPLRRRGRRQPRARTQQEGDPGQGAGRLDRRRRGARGGDPGAPVLGIARGARQLLHRRPRARLVRWRRQGDEVHRHRPLRGRGGRAAPVPEGPALRRLLGEGAGHRAGQLPLLEPGRDASAHGGERRRRSRLHPRPGRLPPPALRARAGGCGRGSPGRGPSGAARPGCGRRRRRAP